MTGNKDLHTLKEELLILVWSFYRLVLHFYKGKEKDKRILNMIWLGESRCWNMLWNKKGISVYYYYYYYLLGYLWHVYHCCHSSLHTLISLTNLFCFSSCRAKYHRLKYGTEVSPEKMSKEEENVNQEAHRDSSTNNTKPVVNWRQGRQLLRQ